MTSNSLFKTLNCGCDKSPKSNIWINPVNSLNLRLEIVSKMCKMEEVSKLLCPIFLFKYSTTYLNNPDSIAKQFIMQTSSYVYSIILGLFSYTMNLTIFTIVNTSFFCNLLILIFSDKTRKKLYLTICSLTNFIAFSSVTQQKVSKSVRLRYLHELKMDRIMVLLMNSKRLLSFTNIWFRLFRKFTVSFAKSDERFCENCLQISFIKLLLELFR